MRTLKNLLSVTYYFIIVTIVLMLLILIPLWFNLIPIFTKAIKEDFDLEYIFKFSFFIELLSVPIFLVMVKKMKLISINFSNKIYFSIENSIYLKQIGYCFIALYFIENILCQYFFPLVNDYNNFNWFEDFNPFDLILSTFYKLIIGIFLLGIGKAFELGLKQQQENELTI